MSFIKLGNLLNRSMGQSDLAKKIKAAMTVDAYSLAVKEIFGNQVAEKVKPLYVRDKVLTVACLNPVVAQELKFKEEEILKLIYKNNQHRDVERVRYLL